MSVRSFIEGLGPRAIAAFLMFLVFLAGSSYWYVCGIKKMCGAKKPQSGVVKSATSTTTPPVISPATTTTPLPLSSGVPYTGPTNCAVLADRDIGVGSFGDDVLRIERALNAFGYGRVSENGIFEATDADAVARFQAHANLIQSGSVDINTRNKLSEIACEFL